MEQFKFLKDTFTNEKVIPPIRGAIAAAYSDGTECPLGITNSSDFQKAVLNDDGTVKHIYVITPEQLTPTVEVGKDNNDLQITAFSSKPRDGGSLPTGVDTVFNNINLYSNIKIAPIGKINWNFGSPEDATPTDMLMSVNGEYAFKKATYTVSGSITYDKYEVLDGAGTLDIEYYKLSGNLKGTSLNFSADDKVWYDKGIKYYKATSIEPVDTKSYDISKIIKSNTVADEVGSISFTVTPRVSEESTTQTDEYYVKLNDGAVPIITNEITESIEKSVDLFTNTTVGKLNILYIFKRTGDIYTLERIIPFQKDANKCYKKDNSYVYISEDACYVSDNSGVKQLVKASTETPVNTTLYPAGIVKFFDETDTPYITDYKEGDDLYCKQIEDISLTIGKTTVDFDNNGNILPKNYTITTKENDLIYFKIYKDMALNKTCTIS